MVEEAPCTTELHYFPQFLLNTCAHFYQLTLEPVYMELPVSGKFLSNSEIVLRNQLEFTSLMS
jgi:hypothetical protein